MQIIDCKSCSDFVIIFLPIVWGPLPGRKCLELGQQREEDQVPAEKLHMNLKLPIICII